MWVVCCLGILLLTMSLAVVLPQTLERFFHSNLANMIDLNSPLSNGIQRVMIQNLETGYMHALYMLSIFLTFILSHCYLYKPFESGTSLIKSSVPLECLLGA